MSKKIVFLTGTRADFGKLKSLIDVLLTQPGFEVHIFATGMHLDEKYGSTVHEIEKYGYRNIFKFINHDNEAMMDLTLSRTISGFADFVRLVHPDLIVVHGDRIEALVGASVGALNNILVAHIEGGELSGTVDELIRHAVSKLSHTHFVANAEAGKRLVQMGELSSSIFEIGSPDMDVMLGNTLPSLDAIKQHYNISFDQYAVSLFHPVTTELDNLAAYAADYFQALQTSGLNYVVVYPNNDKGSELIMQQVRKLQQLPQFRIFPSLRFEAFLGLMQQASFVIGNSSAGIREAPYYGVPTVNVGSRQNRRSKNPDIIHAGYNTASILSGIQQAQQKKLQPKQLFGNGNSDARFVQILSKSSFWQIPRQKLFADLEG